MGLHWDIDDYTPVMCAEFLAVNGISILHMEHIVGEYAGRQATRHCMTFKNTTLLFSGAQEDSDHDTDGDRLEQQDVVDTLLGGWFCFVQTDNGKIVAVYHSHDDLPDIVNFKKSVAASFQTNSMHSEEEEEEDPQSTHISHYRQLTAALVPQTERVIVQTGAHNEDQERIMRTSSSSLCAPGPNNSSNSTYLQMYESQEDMTIVHRNFDSRDVVEYPNLVPRDEVELTKEEHLTYRSGVLEHTSGSVNVHVFPSAEEPEISSGSYTTDTNEEKTYDGSFHANKFSASGSYSLDLEYCYNVPRVAERKRRDTQESMRKGYTRSTLSAHHNETTAVLHRMEVLRQEIPSVQEALNELHHTPTNSKLVISLQQLLQLESQYGPLHEHTPAINPVLEYLELIMESDDPDDLQMRLVMYSLLSGEGSLQSQMALLTALDQVNDEKERNTLITFIAFIENADPSFVTQLEKRIGTDPESSDPLLLAYGALASTASSEVQDMIVRFLQTLLDNAKNNTEVIVHLIHSLGNTGCDTAVDIVIGYLNNGDPRVQLTAVDALRKHTSSPVVQSTFLAMLSQPDTNEQEIEAIIQTLIFGFEHQKLKRLKQLDNTLLLTALVSAAVKLDNPDLQQLLTHYLVDLNTKDSQKHVELLKDKVQAASNDTTTRLKRGTTDWDAYGSTYDLVASYSSRQQDVITYPYHRAYIWGKYLGVSKLNCEVAAGGFVGVDNDGSHFKLFGKAVAKGHAFGRTVTALDAEILLEKENTDWHGKLYAKVLGNTLVNSEQQRTLEWNYSWPLYNSPNYKIISFEYPIFIFVGILRFEVGMYARLSVDADLEAKVDVVSSASTAVIPRVTMTASASASASLLELIRGGIRVSASLTYQVEPRASTSVCIPQFDYRNCLTVYDEWPPSYVDIYAYWQHRTIKWCKAWFIPYPCGFNWGSEHRWDSASVRWDLYSSPKRSIYSTCDPVFPCPIPGIPY